MSGAKGYTVPVGAARAYVHAAPDRTARVGAIPTTAEAIRYRVWPTRSAMLAAYYAHSPRCGAASHECIRPIVGEGVSS